MTRRKTPVLGSTPPSNGEPPQPVHGDVESAASIRGTERDAARADVGVEERHRRATQMVARFARHESLEATVIRALTECRSLCLDDGDELAAVAAHVVLSIRQGNDGAYLRELLGEVPADRMTRMHAHGALLQRATDAAWRLAGGGT